MAGGKQCAMYIGVGTLLLVIIILLLVFLVF
jgi:hypothetical protein